MDNSGNEYVRPSDPETSHEAAAELDVKSSSFAALEYFLTLEDTYHPDGITSTEFEQYIEGVLIAKGWDEHKAHRRADSLRRRLTDLEKKYQRLKLQLNGEGKRKKRNKQQIYYSV
jgi:hypothetical protein